MTVAATPGICCCFLRGSFKHVDDLGLLLHLLEKLPAADPQLVLLDLFLQPRLLLGQLLARQKLLRQMLLALEDVVHVGDVDDLARSAPAAG